MDSALTLKEKIMIAFLGTGLLGANFTKALLKKGEEVRVWNRTRSKADTLVSFGAIVAGEPAEAVRNAKRIHLTLSDDHAVDEILEKASPGFIPGAILIDHTTTSVAGATKRSVYWKDKGFPYIHAPVFMGPSNALDGTGYMLVSGDQEIIREIEPGLSAMTGKLVNFGSQPEKAAGIKLLGNLFLMSLTAGIADTLSLAKSLHIPPADIESLFSVWNPGAMAPGRLKRILSNQFGEPSWELRMARKDARLMMEEAALGGSPLGIIPAIAAEMDKWIARGHGNDDWTIIAKDSVS